MAGPAVDTAFIPPFDRLITAQRATRLRQTRVEVLLRFALTVLCHFSVQDFRPFLFFILFLFIFQSNEPRCLILK